jgi:tetratricopeptide (TPR) repeat protein
MKIEGSMTEGREAMNDAQSLYQAGVTALRERKDVAEGRRLLVAALRADPQNDMAWVWLARVTSNADKKRDCLNRALAINPQNVQAVKLLAQMEGAVATATDAPLPPSAQAERRMAVHMKKAEHYVDAGDPESAIAEWVQVLHLQVDHAEALRQAVSYLTRMKYLDDAHELVWRAIKAGSQNPSIYLTAIDLARLQGDHVEADMAREDLARLPNIPDETIVRVTQHFMNDEQPLRALDLLNEALAKHPDSQPILTALGDAHRLMDNDIEAMRYYDRAARLGSGTKAGRAADKKLLEYSPILTDRERGSPVLAWREAAGIAVFFLFLGWQDAGLDLLRLGPLRWLGVALGLVGGYLLVTATSSPQQQPIARLLGGYVPDFSDRNQDARKGLIEEGTGLPIIPPVMRLVLGVIGALLLAAGLYLVFQTAVQLLLDPVWPEELPRIENFM